MHLYQIATLNEFFRNTKSQKHKGHLHNAFSRQDIFSAEVVPAHIKLLFEKRMLSEKCNIFIFFPQLNQPLL